MQSYSQQCPRQIMINNNYKFTYYFNLDTEFDTNAQVTLEEIQSCYVKKTL